MEVFTIANDHQINEQIRDRSVRVVAEDGEQLGVMSSLEAMDIADEKGLDLVKVSPNAKPPVCKIMDYGKYRFEQSKKMKEAKKNQKIVNKFLKAGDKVKISIRFKGRQMAHTEKGREAMKKFYAMVEENAVIEKNAKLEGRNMFMILASKN